MKRPYYEVQVRQVIDGARGKWRLHCRLPSEQEAVEAAHAWSMYKFAVPHEFRIRPLPGEINGPTVQCSIGETPSLRGRSYVSLYKDAKGQPIPVSDLGKPKSQKKLRRIRRRQLS